jgi:glycosyltransferase involved in cell wall biosynthesis
MLRRVVHCTSVHAWDDTRIFHKMACSLAKAGYDAHVIAIDRSATEAQTFVSKGVTVHLLPGTDIGSRLVRTLKGGRRVAAKATALGGDIVHIHDPELVPLLLGGFGKRAKLVFDAHEDLPGQIDAKSWVPPAARPLFRLAARALELLARRADGLVAATPHIAARFGERAVAVQNFPLLEEFPATVRKAGGEIESGRTSAIYVGGITRARGIVPMIQAIALADDIEIFHLAGTFQSEVLLEEVKKLAGWTKTRFHGQASRPLVSTLMGTSDVGLVTILPHRNYLNSQPTKLYEYLYAGLLLVVSDFPVWRELLAPDRLAEFVDPADPVSIAAGIRRAVALPVEERERRRSVGRALVGERINWESEFAKLRDLYERL